MPAPERIPPRSLRPAPFGSARPAGSPPPGQPTARALETGELTVHGQIADASNGVLYCTVEVDGRRVPCVYKPVAGERPLWDFPEGTLARREVAAYEVSRASGWDLIPLTVLRDGPYGEGMCQMWVGPAPFTANGPEPEEGSGTQPAAEAAPAASGQTSEEAPGAAPAEASPGSQPPPEPADGADLLGAPGRHRLLALVDGDQPGPGWKAVGFAQVGEGRTALLVHADHLALGRLAVLDAVINNGDRKGRHLLHTTDGRLQAIDHGVSFHTDDKLRTLLWGWSGEPLPPEAVRVLRHLAAELAPDRPLATRLAQLLTADEVEAVRTRTATLLATGHYPRPGGDWPAIPWPPV